MSLMIRMVLLQVIWYGEFPYILTYEVRHVLAFLNNTMVSSMMSVALFFFKLMSVLDLSSSSLASGLLCSLRQPGSGKKVQILTDPGPVGQFKLLLSADNVPLPRFRKSYILAIACLPYVGDEYTWLEYARKPSRRDIGSRMLYRDAHMTGWAYKAGTQMNRTYSRIFCL